MPCDHGFAVLYYLSKNKTLTDVDWDPYSAIWLNEVFYSDSWKQQYNDIFLVPEKINDPSTSTLKPWSIVPAQKGRPKEKRFKRAVHGRKIRKCSYCNKPGHNKKTCKFVDTDQIYRNLIERTEFNSN